MYGFCGAQRVGKSTLAQEISKIIGAPALMTSGSKVFAEMGLDPKVDYPIETRMDIQRRILDAFADQYRTTRIESDVFFADRTPIDLIAYTLADVRRENVPSNMEKVIESYVKDCFDVSNEFFSVLFVVQPGIEPIEEAGKAPASYAYTEHISNMVMGLVVSEFVKSDHFYIPRRHTSLENRIKCVKNGMLKAADRFIKATEDEIVFH